VVASPIQRGAGPGIPTPAQAEAAGGLNIVVGDPKNRIEDRVTGPTRQPRRSHHREDAAVGNPQQTNDGTFLVLTGPIGGILTEAGQHIGEGGRIADIGGSGTHRVDQVDRHADQLFEHRRLIAEIHLGEADRAGVAVVEWFVEVVGQDRDLHPFGGALPEIDPLTGREP
jgi:hypothetical protein